MDGGTTVAVGSNAEDFTGTPIPAKSTAVSVSFLLGSILRDRAVIMDEQCKECEMKHAAEKLKQQGVEQHHKGLFQAALQSWNNALTIYRQIQDRYREGEVLGNLGVAYKNLGKYTKAIECYQQHLKIAREIKSLEEEARALGNLGVVYKNTGEYKKAINYYDRQIQIAKEIKDDLQVAIALGNLGVVYKNLGEYKRAIEHYQKQFEIAEKLNSDWQRLNVFSNLGIVYRNIGNYIKSITYHKQQLEIAKKIGNYQKEGKALGGLGIVYDALRDYNRSIDYHRRHLEIAILTQDRQGEARALGNLGIAYHHLGEYMRAIDFHKRSLSISREINDIQGEANSLGSIGSVYHDLENYTLAIDYFKQDLELQAKISNLRGQGNSLNNLGRTLQKAGKLVEAEEKLYQALNVWQLLHSSLGSRDADKISFSETQASSYRLLQKALVSQNKIEKALEISEQGRSRAFVDLLIERLPNQSTNSYKSNLLAIQKIKELAINQALTIVEYSVLDSGMLLLIWVIKPTGEVIFRQLKTEFLKQENPSLMMFFTQGFEPFPINESETGTLAQDGRKYLSANFLTIQELRQLHRLLIQPIAHLLPSNSNDTIVFIPTGNLFLISFAALQDQERKYFIEKHNIIIAPSIQVVELIRKRSIEASETPLEALVVGNPKMPIIPLSEPPIQLKDLAWAKTEANAIAHLLNTQPITGSDATKAYITQQMPKVRFIHFATHGLLDDIRQLGIPGALALSSNDEDNGFLTAGEIYDMKLNAELVVLSACGTGQGKITGDGVIGLSRCLITAGVKSVIVSLWSVDDLSTTLLMMKFYQIFQQGVAVTIALNEAQRWLMSIGKSELTAWIKTNENFFDATLKLSLSRRLHQLDGNTKPFEDPRYWAAFCVIGQ